MVGTTHEYIPWFHAHFSAFPFLHFTQWTTVVGSLTCRHASESFVAFLHVSIFKHFFWSLLASLWMKRKWELLNWVGVFIFCGKVMRIDDKWWGAEGLFFVLTCLCTDTRICCGKDSAGQWQHGMPFSVLFANGCVQFLKMGKKKVL
jgi:hypothetical protein